MRFLLDENISPQIADHLTTQNHDVITVHESYPALPDEEIVELALEDDRIILTQDLDFGNIYYFSKRGEVTIVVVRPAVQTIDTLKDILDNHLDRVEEEEGKALFVLREDSYRILR